jgi:uncharacterized repeat protein (TIGR01451 family)
VFLDIGRSKLQTALAVTIGAGLFLLCACANSGRVTTAPTSVSTPVATPIPGQTLRPLPTRTVVPASLETGQSGESAQPISAARSLTHSLGITGAAAASEPPSDVGIEALSPIQVAPGGTAVYTLTIYNHGPSPATGIVVTDVLPLAVTPAWTRPAQPLCGQEGPVVGCDLGYIGSSSAATVTMDLLVSDTVTLMSDPQLTGISLDSAAPTCTIGRELSGTSVVCNLDRLAPGAQTDFGIAVDVGAGVTGRYVHTATVAASGTDAEGSNNRAAATMIIGTAASPEIEANLAAADLVLRSDGPERVTAGEPFTYTFTITNLGALDASGVILRDDLPPGTVLSAVSPDLPLCNPRRDALTCYLRDASSGETFTFTLAVTGSPGTRMSVEVDPLAPGWPICLLIKEASKIHRVDCNLGTLSGGAATRVDLVVIAEGVLERQMANTATVQTSDTEGNDVNNTATTTTTVQVEADLALQSAVAGPAIAGKPVQYVLTVTNTGPSDAYGVAVTDRLPANTALVSALASQGDGCRVDQGTTPPGILVCDLGHLKREETASITVNLAVDASLTRAAAETISHFASVVAEQSDPDLSNNEVMEFIPISAEVEPTVVGDTGD